MGKLPAGMVDNNLEVYRSDYGVKAVSNGNSCSYLELANVLREPFQVELINDRAALHCLRGEFCLSDFNDIEEKFVSCRYGALNHSPDWDGIKLRHDPPCCPHVKDCKGFDIICKVPVGPTGKKLSRSEYLVAEYIGIGLQDKEIALKLGIKQPTVRTYINRITEKLEVNNRVEIAYWATTEGIV